MSDLYDAASSSIAQFGTHNPKVDAFLNATFALESMGIAGLNQASEANPQSVGNASTPISKGR